MRLRTARASALGAILCCALGFGLVSTPALGDSLDQQKNQIDGKVDRLQNAVEDTSKELAAAFGKLEKTQAQLPEAQARVAETQSLEAAAQSRTTELTAQLVEAQRKMEQAEARVAENATKLAAFQNALDRLAADAFQGGQTSQLAVAMGAATPDEFAAQLSLADTMSTLTDDALRNLQTLRAESAAEESYLSAVRDEIAVLKTAAEQALAAARIARTDAQAAKAALEKLIGQREKYAAEDEKRREKELAALRAAEKEQERLAAELKERARKAKLAAEAAAAKAHANPQPSTGGSSRGGWLNYPANGPITSEFGMRFHPILRYWKLHSGTDFGIPCGTPVYATASGTIFGAFYNVGYGNRILIDHGIVKGVNLVTTYNHLSSFVRTSGHVERGQLIGYSGTTGYSTGCHLHFETLEDGTFVNPRTWI